MFDLTSVYRPEIANEIPSLTFDEHRLSESHRLLIGTQADQFAFIGSRFEQLWDLHPEEFSELRIHGKWVKMPRWQSIFGADYHFSGRVHAGAPVPELLQPLLGWARQHVEPRLNGVVVTWYDGSLGHYIGKHRDSTRRMVPGAPIVMLSFGQQRTLRLRPWKRSGRYYDFPVCAGTVVILPYETNLAWTHEVPRSTRATGRRVSVTLRAFEPSPAAQR